jgi:hypothetical protein
MSDDKKTPKTEAILKVIGRLEGHGPFTDAELEDETFRKWHRRDSDTFAKVREAIKTLADIVNGSGNNRIIRAAVVNEIIRTHRHLQQELLSTLLLAFGDLASLAEEDEARWTDGRNEHIYDVLQKMKAKLGEKDFYFDTPGDHR